ncbi:MAG: alanine racemase [Bradymonadia bacterium]
MPTQLKDVTTPCAVIDRQRFIRNCQNMSARAARLGVALRPHAKTHKSPEGLAHQLAGDHHSVTVSTLAEARAFARAGVRDILWAVPPALEQISHIFELNAWPEIERLDVLCDHPTILEAIAREGALRQCALGVWLEIDCGDARGGLSPEGQEIQRLAERAQASPWIELRGLLTHGGQSYACTTSEEIVQVAEQERDAIVRCAQRLRALGIEIHGVSLGSTPTLTHAAGLEGVTEVRPGNYALFDAFQHAIGSCALDEIAYSVVATIIGRYPERGTLVVNAGALALSKDPGPTHVDPECGYGIVVDAEQKRIDGLKIVSLSQEHGVIKVEGGLRVEAEDPRWHIGERVRIIPNHSCLSAALFERYHVVEGDTVVEQWHPARGW